MNWRSVSFIECDEETPKKLKLELKALGQCAELLNTERAEIDHLNAELDSATLTPDIIAKLGDVRNRKIVAWQTEVELRKSYTEWLDKYHPALRVLADAAHPLIAAVETDLRAKLVAIGYVDCEPTLQQPGKITQGMILTHPSHIAARRRWGDLTESAINSAISHRKLNQSCLVETEAEMEAFRKRLRSVA